MSLNVNRNVSDAFYRYKMPKLLAKVEGKGNGIKTVIVNMSEVAKAIGCPPTYPCKFFGCELGAQTQFNYKDDRYIVNGSHEAGKLQQLLDVFIKKFILCNECENPETVLLPNEKKQTIRQTCKACGHAAMLDMRHRLTTFILKNPPDIKPDTAGTSMTQKKDRQSKKKSDACTNGDGKSDSNGLDDDDWDLDEDLDLDVSDVAVKKRMEEMSAGVKHLTVSNHANKTQSEKLQMFYEYCRDKRDSGILKAGADKSVYKDISSEADSLELKDSKAVMAIIELLFDQQCLAQVDQYWILLLHFTHKNQKAQKYLLGAFEKLVELHKTDLMPKVAHILKKFFDKDIIDEEVLLEWGKKASKKYVSKELSQEIQNKAAPFITWLQEAESESEEEESEEEDDVEIGFSAGARASTLKEQEGSTTTEKKPAVAEIAAPAGAAEEEDDGSDVDIDDI